MSRQPAISFKNENMLLVNKKPLRADVLEFESKRLAPISAEKLHTILTVGNVAIRDQIEMIYQRVSKTNQNVARASILAVNLSGDEHSWRDVYDNEYKNSGMISTDRDVVLPPFQPYWDAVKEAGFYPEVGDSYFGMGTWMYLRDDDFQRSGTV